MAVDTGENPLYVAWAAPSCADNTPASSYQTDTLPIATCWLWSLNVRIPPGHAGLTGIALVDSGQWIIPYGQGSAAWLIGDDDDLTFDYDQQLGETVALAYYNTSTLYTHGWQVRLLYTPMSAYDQGGGVITTPASADWLEVAAGE